MGYKQKRWAGRGMGKKNVLSSFLSSSHSLPISIQNGSLIHCSLHRGNYFTFHNNTPSLQAKVDKVFVSFGVMWLRESCSAFCSFQRTLWIGSAEVLDANTQCSGMTCRVQEKHCMLREWTECYMPMSYIKQQTALYKEKRKEQRFLSQES